LRRKHLQRLRKSHSKARASRKKAIWKLTNETLTPKQRLARKKSLEALSLVRREKRSLPTAAKQIGLTQETIIRNTNAFRKVRGRWKAKSIDHIPRVMTIYEKGRKRIVEVANSRTASLIGEYHNRVKHFLDTSKSSFLRELPKKRFKDKAGRIHVLETDPRAILTIKAREPKPEFFEIYHR
jgi:hypothetical protein